jgi:two-component system, cell cycle response regulator
MEDRTTRITTIRQLMSGAPTGTECLVEIYGARIGRKYDLYEDEVSLGRDPDNTIVLESDSVSRRHARIERVADERYVTDMNSTNGTYINDAPVQRARLTSGSFLKIGDTIFKYLTGDNLEASYYEEIHRMAVTDGLTQAANKRALDEFLDREMSRARRYQRPLAVLMLDLDHFKNVNDTYGHLTGDLVLREMAAVVKPRIRREELFARYGGEEFVVALPEGDASVARELAETLRAMIAEHPVVFEGRTIRITVSIGIGEFERDLHRSPSDLLKTADRNLYAAKAAGRNCVHG